MKKIISNSKTEEKDMLPEYDFSKAKRVGNKYLKRLSKGTNIIIIEPELRKEFPNSASVNSALKKFLRVKQNVS